jgi:hypothetical protein
MTDNLQTQETNWTQHIGYKEIKGRDCTITLEKRPAYCDRGNFISKLHAKPDAGDHSLLFIDEQDGWPRYYFDEDRAKLEIEAWLVKRNQNIEPPPPPTPHDIGCKRCGFINDGKKRHRRFYSVPNYGTVCGSCARKVSPGSKAS